MLVWARHGGRRLWTHAWEALDPEPIIALYAAGATLSTEPFREPYRGRDGVRAYVTRVFGEEQDPRVWVSDPVVDGNRASISWWASLREEGVDATLAGTSVLRFDDHGLVVEQWDAWTTCPSAATRQESGAHSGRPPHPSPDPRGVPPLGETRPIIPGSARRRLEPVEHSRRPSCRIVG